MRAKSHRCLGQYLIRHYMPQLPDLQTRAFLLGCVQPDKNPATYLKGSLRCQWLRGHNYPNAKRFITRIAERLEQKSHWNLYDYYTLGKLIHYIADAFTLAHNASFPVNLDAHRSYEAILQNHFLTCLHLKPSVVRPPEETAAAAISHYRRLYDRSPSGIYTDTAFSLNACCSVVSVLTASKNMQ